MRLRMVVSGGAAGASRGLDLAERISALSRGPVHVESGDAESVRTGGADLVLEPMRDVPLASDGLVVAATPRRGDPRDALVGRSLTQLAPGSMVGTTSLARHAQLAALRPDLRMKPLWNDPREAVDQVRAGQIGAAVLGLADLRQLGLMKEVVQTLSRNQMVPGVTEGILALRCRDGAELRALLRELHHPPTALAALAERAFLAEVGAERLVACHARVRDDGVELWGFLLTENGIPLRRQARGQHRDARWLGRALAMEVDLLARGLQGRVSA